MTSVPKPLKFLRPQYPTLEAIYEKWPTSDDKVRPEAITRLNVSGKLIILVGFVRRHSWGPSNDLL
jgi:hypothetical protein